MTSRRTAWVVGTCVVLLLAVAVAGVVLLREGRAEEGTTWDDYRVTERGLVVRKQMRDCDTLEVFDVLQRRSRVTITVSVDSGGLFCAEGEATQRLRIRLDDPLGKRTVLDGACLAGDEPRRRCVRGTRR